MQDVVDGHIRNPMGSDEIPDTDTAIFFVVGDAVTMSRVLLIFCAFRPR
jgi:hypothetical protein